MIIYGRQIINSAMKYAPDKIVEFYLAKEIDRESFVEISRLNKPILRVDSKKAQAYARGGNHQGFLALIEDLEQTDLSNILNGSNILVLSDLSDVGNIGSIFRSALAFGVDGIIISDTSLSKSAIEGILRTSSGAMFMVPFCVVKNSLEIINNIKNRGFTCYGASMDGQDMESVPFEKKWALFMGSEGNGLSAKIKKKMDKIVSVNMRGDFDSLNVGVATGILLYRLQK